ncbi:MATE family efflux transporter [Lachnospira pectinoschiza]|uniref:Na+-driven multidrug efflux pump n=1 Tax=Lachnospira pectinoschiza TaxID=28052 RepID=A0A1G9U275_9FIRM|nr:MATE family efflux transporter [Lachnospira pectinoschiza]SDM54022.1 Na+-driven multidrug efflux pump [Lachnospira pectinoschiza]
MDLLTGKISKIYFKYLAAAFGSALIVSIYALVDTIVIGRYEGPNGTAAVANFMPMWSIMYALGICFGIGGSVLLAHKRGAGKFEESNKYFTTSVVLSVIASIIIFIVYNIWDRQLLYLSGGRGAVLDLSTKYCFYIAFASPLFIIGQMLIPLVRVDGKPFITTVAVMAGGIFNVFGDIYFAFGLDMGILGASLATAIGQLICVLILLAHILLGKCNLKLNFKNLHLLKRIGQVISTGSATFIVDIAIGVVTILVNNQIMRYSGETALAVYGVISSYVTAVQSVSYAVGESGQAIISTNYGAGNAKRVIGARRVMLTTALVGGIFFCIIAMLFPNAILRLYMKPTAEVYAIGAGAIRLYCLDLIFLMFNIASTYYFQAVNRLSVSLVVSLARGFFVNGLLVMLLPLIFGINGVWIAIPIAELIVAIYVAFMLRKKLVIK